MTRKKHYNIQAMLFICFVIASVLIISSPLFLPDEISSDVRVLSLEENLSFIQGFQAGSLAARMFDSQVIFIKESEVKSLP